MSKAEKSNEATKNKEVAQPNEETNDVSTMDETGFDFTKLNKSEKKQSLLGQYLTMEMGESVRGFFMGISDQEIKGKMMPCVGFYMEEGAFFTASHIIVQGCRRAEKGDGIEIIYKGVKELKGGNRMGDYEVNQISID